MDNKVIGVMAFIGGIAVGANMNRIKHYLKSALKNIKPALAKNMGSTSLKVISVRKEQGKKEVTVKTEELPAKEEISTEKDKILSILKHAPNGKTITELSSAMGTHFIKLTKPIKELLAEQKVHKEGTLYVYSK